MSQKPPHNSETKEVPETLSEPLAKSVILRTCQKIFQKELNEDETKFWAKLMEPIPVNALRYAFDTWNNGAEFFPRPKNILDLVVAYNLSKPKKCPFCGKCHEGWIKTFEGTTEGGHPVDPKRGAMTRCECTMGRTQHGFEPYQHYGQGYGENDIKYLMKRYMLTRQAVGNRALTDVEVNGLLDDLDKKRGETPEWRRHT